MASVLAPDPGGIVEATHQQKINTLVKLHPQFAQILAKGRSDEQFCRKYIQALLTGGLWMSVRPETLNHQELYTAIEMLLLELHKEDRKALH